MGILYKLDFPNGKSYIGISTLSLDQRMREHRKKAFGRGKEKGFALHEAWRKYGDPVAQVLAVLENGELHSTEIRAIAYYGTRPPHGYNLTIGGDGVLGRQVSEETKEKLRLANLGKKQSPETIAKKCAALKGRQVSEETRRKIGEKNKINSSGKSPSAHTRKLLSEASKGRTHSVSEDARARMSAAKKGKPWTEAQRKARLDSFDNSYKLSEL